MATRVMPRARKIASAPPRSWSNPVVIASRRSHSTVSMRPIPSQTFSGCGPSRLDRGSQPPWAFNIAMLQTGDGRREWFRHPMAGTDDLVRPPSRSQNQVTAFGCLTSRFSGLNSTDQRHSNQGFERRQCSVSGRWWPHPELTVSAAFRSFRRRRDRGASGRYRGTADIGRRWRAAKSSLERLRHRCRRQRRSRAKRMSAAHSAGLTHPTRCCRSTDRNAGGKADIANLASRPFGSEAWLAPAQRELPFAGGHAARLLRATFRTEPSTPRGVYADLGVSRAPTLRRADFSDRRGSSKGQRQREGRRRAPGFSMQVNAPK